MKTQTETKRGFTLIELLVVIAIIGILSSVVLASLNSARKKGRDARRISDLKQLSLALDLYYDANGQTYPIQGGTPNFTTDLTPLVTQGFISSLPQDPNNSGTYVYSYRSVDGTGAVCSASPCSSYLLKSVIEGGATAVPTGDVDDASSAAAAALVCDDPSYCVRP